MTLQSARDALVNVGLAKPGRGKFSNAAKEWLDEQDAAGVKFSDWPKVTETVTHKIGRRTITRTRVVNPVNIPKEPEKRYASGSKAYTRVNGKRVYGQGQDHGMREVCNNCRVSLFYCICSLMGRQAIANINNRLLSVPVEIEAV